MSSLLRSTKFVRYFTGAARTLILNSVKTTEANTLLNTKALSGANNALVRDYATSKKTESLEPLLQKLDAEVKKFGRITKRDIDEVFDELRSKHNITSSQSLLIIRCCGDLVPEEPPEQRTLLVQKIWNVLNERGVPMDISHYNALLRVYIENEHPFSPAQFLEELEKKGLEPNRVTYQRLMWRYCQEGDVTGATRVLERMRELSMPVSEPVLNALVMGHALHGDTEGARAVLQTMAGAGLEPSARTYTLLACGYAKKGDLTNVEATIKDATDKDIVLSDKDILDIVEHMAVGGHGDKVEPLFLYLHRGAGYNQDVCNLILKLLNKGLDDTAKRVMTTMRETQYAEGNHLFKGAFFVKQLIKVKKSPEEVIKMCRELKAEELIPNALFIATENALASGNCGLALALFKELKRDGVEIRTHYYYPLLATRAREKDEEGLLQTLKSMHSEQVQVTMESLRDYVVPFLLSKDSAHDAILKLQIANVPTSLASKSVLVQVLENGDMKLAAELALQFRPRGNHKLMARPLLNALAKTEDLAGFATILQVISSGKEQAQTEEDSDEDNNLAAEVGRIVRSAVKTVPAEKAESLLLAVRDRGLRISMEEAEKIQQYLGQNLTAKISELLSELTSEDLEPVPLDAAARRPSGANLSSNQLEQLIEKQRNAGQQVGRLQRQLLGAYIAENNLEKVESYLNELEGTEFEVPIATLAQLYEFFCQHDRIDRAKECETKIRTKDTNFVLNKYKHVMLAFALVRAGKSDEAVQYLQDHKVEAVDDSGFAFNSKCWQMLNYLAEQKDPEKVRQLTEVLISCNFVEASNVLLGPLIKAHLLRDDLGGALQEFERVCKKYRCTPWKGELMKRLIEKEDAAKLQWLADLSTEIHGEVNVLHDLVLAFVECGRLRQARRILETPGLQSRHKRLDTACQRYQEEGKTEHLEGLLEATKQLNYIDRSNIFYHLLQTYCKADDTDKALGLWTLLQEEGEVPSEKFLKTLGTHLRAKGREVPFVLPDSQAQAQSQAKAKARQNQSATKSKTEISSKLEELIAAGQLEQAFEYALTKMKTDSPPKNNVLKYMLKRLAEEGEVEKIEEFGKFINDDEKKQVTYDDKLTAAIVKRGSGSEHAAKVLRAVESAASDHELEQALRGFPRSQALGALIQDQETVDICNKIIELAASKGKTLPANLIWLEYILADKFDMAEQIWNKYLSHTTSVIVFRRLLQTSYERSEPKYMHKLLDFLKTNANISKNALGNAYSRLISLYVEKGDLKMARKILEEAQNAGVTSEQINKRTLTSLLQV